MSETEETVSFLLYSLFAEVQTVEQQNVNRQNVDIQNVNRQNVHIQNVGLKMFNYSIN
jgi:hypothetical protein